jgi:hypothetical protein
MLAVPLNETPPMVLAVCKAVAVAALPVVDPEEPDTLPVKLAVIVPAEKLPEASRKTIVEAVLAVAAVIVALFAWLVIVPAVVADVAVEALPDNAAVIVPALKLPEASRATIVEAVFRLVALDATVNVEAPAWLAVNEAEPDRPVPDTAIVSAPLLAAATGATHEGAAAPFDCSRYVEVPAAN